MRANRINLVRAIYKANQDISDDNLIGAYIYIFDGNETLSKNTLSVWKSMLRKEGLKIKDGRKRQTANRTA